MFTLEVAIQTMPKSVEQLVLLFDASKFTILPFHTFIYRFEIGVGVGLVWSCCTIDLKSVPLCISLVNE